jgi:DNA-directed RNA polymerase subunit RPC12/RpoP
MAGRYCKNCGRTVRPVRAYEVNHIAHILGTVLLCGAWLPFWFLACLMSAMQGYQCPVCGRRV